MKIYFSHPSFTYHTKTEKRCIRFIRSKFENLEKIINPASFGALKDSKSQIQDSDIIVGMAIENKYTFLVWKEIEFAQKNELKVFSINANNKNQISDITEGMKEDYEKLSREESHKFSKKQELDNRSFKSILLGSKSKF